MLKRISSVFACMFLAGLCAFAQSSGGTYSSYTPYSVYGIGDVSSPGSAMNASMGGIGIATRSHKFINSVNPASITARDSLSVMADISMAVDNKMFRQGDMKSASNICNIKNIAVTLPIYRSSAFIIGIAPYSSTGYGASFPETDPAMISSAGNIANVYTGKGSVYQFYTGAAVTFWDRFSIGAEYIYYFGSINKEYCREFANENYLNANYNYELVLRAHSGKFGIQYEQLVGKKFKVCAGATYTLKADLNGVVSKSVYSLGTVTSEDSKIYTRDTLDYHVPKASIASEFGVGLSLNYIDKVKAEINYTRSNWKGCQFETIPGLSTVGKTGVTFMPSVSYSVRAGMEYTPNRNDIRYYMKRVSYRAGAYYRTEGYKVDGHDIFAAGLTLGATFPVFRWHNGLTIALDLGQRGTQNYNLVKEWYANVSIGINLFDIWFQKHRYE